MPLTRREALGLTFGALAGVPFGTAAFAQGSPGYGLWPIVQGPTDQRSASFVLLLPTWQPYTIDCLTPSGHRLETSVVARFDLPSIGWSAVELVARGLSPGTDYVLMVTDEDGVSDRRLFRAIDRWATRCRFAVASCMNIAFERQATTMWQAMAREACDFVILLGDTCYVDLGAAGTEGGLGYRYLETRLAISWFRMERLVPTIAVWDDHDFGLDNADRTFPLAPFARTVFRAFWGSAGNAAWQPGFGCGSRFEAFGQRFFLLDDRSYRDPLQTTGGRHWGAAQTEWLVSDLGASGTPAWLLNGNKFFGMHLLRESVEKGHPTDLAELTAGLSRIEARVAFVSGDVHFSEVVPIAPDRIGYPTFEFTSSSIHSRPNIGPIHRGNLVADARHNFMVFDTDTSVGWHISSRAILEGNAEAFRVSAQIVH